MSETRRQIELEEQRLAALRAYAVLDTPPERDFDDITALAAQYFDVPVALVSLIDSNRQWFKSRVGTELAQTPRSVAFCDHAIRNSELMLIPDARLDPRFSDNPLVTGDLKVVFYAGAPLISPEGHAIGTLCVMDTRARDLTQGQRKALATMARQVVAQLELRARSALIAGAMKMVEHNETRMGLVLKGANDGWWDWDLTTGERFYSSRGWAMLGYHDHEVPYDGQLWERLIHPDDVPSVNQSFSDAIRSKVDLYASEMRLRHKAGHDVTVLSRGHILRDANGRAIRLSGTNTDLTERKQWADQLQASSNLLSNLADNIPGVVYQLQMHPDGHLSFPFASQGIEDIYEVTPEQVRHDATLVTRRVHPDDYHATLALVRHSARTLTPWQQEYRVILPRQGVRWRLGNARPERLSDGSVLWHGFITDITDRKMSDESIHQLAFFDALTGLPNRRLILDRVSHALDNARRAHTTGALLFLDLDHFKHINDARGHAVGDALLVQVAQRLNALLLAQDTVARLGGDEFVVLMDNLGPATGQGARTALKVAEKIRHELDRPYKIDGNEYISTASVGITVFPRAEESVDDLLREADTAMYRAKAGGRNRAVFFEPAMQAEVEERMAIEFDLSSAIAEQRLDVHVQPQVDATGQVVGGELLLRWFDPVRGQVSPLQFIPVAEESGLILRLGDWVIQQACEALVTLQGLGQQLSLSVNVSPRQFRQDNFVERLQATLRETQANPAMLILEVTEGLLIDNLDDTVARMTQLVAMGIRFSIDDFGTGYSSLAYLKKLPLHELKIDRSFVQDTPGDPNDTAIVQSILAMAAHLQLQVVAEGVETRAQADFLIASHCPCLQGYLFGRPRPLKDWLASLADAL
jgi:diguanylate cyclase (GGDEF)-like protein/PAS domain S-box-containing protein